MWLLCDNDKKLEKVWKLGISDYLCIIKQKIFTNLFLTTDKNMKREIEKLREGLDVISRAALSFTEINYDGLSDEMRELLCRSFIAGALWSSVHMWVDYDEDEDESCPDVEDICVVDVFDKESGKPLGMKLDIYIGGGFKFIGEDEIVKRFIVIPE